VLLNKEVDSFLSHSSLDMVMTCSCPYTRIAYRNIKAIYIRTLTWRLCFIKTLVNSLSLSTLTSVLSGILFWIRMWPVHQLSMAKFGVHKIFFVDIWHCTPSTKKVWWV